MFVERLLAFETLMREHGATIKELLEERGRCAGYLAWRLEHLRGELQSESTAAPVTNTAALTVANPRDHSTRARSARIW